MEAQPEAADRTTSQRIVALIPRLIVIFCSYIMIRAGDLARPIHLLPIGIPLILLECVVVMLPEHKRASVIRPSDALPGMLAGLLSKSDEGINAVCAGDFLKWAGRMPCWAATGFYVVGVGWWGITVLKVAFRLRLAFNTV